MSKERWFRIRMIERERGDAPHMASGPQITMRVTGKNKRDVEKRHEAQGRILSVEPVDEQGRPLPPRAAAGGNRRLRGARDLKSHPKGPAECPAAIDSSCDPGPAESAP